MITSMILSDDILGNKLDNEMSLKLKGILDGIWANGMLLDSANSSCMKNIKRQLENVSIKYHKDISIFIEEMGKNPKRYFFNCLEDTCPIKKCKEIAFLSCLANQCMADALVAPTPPSGVQNTEVVTLDSYDNSITEKQRKKYLSGEPNFYSLTGPEKTIFWKRIMAYTRNINIYDGHIGTAETNVDAFSDTLKYLTENWIKHCMYKKDLALNITTLSKKWPVNKMKNYFKKEFIDKLNTLSLPPITVTVYVKTATEDSFHGRYLETDSRVFKCDPGFDFYKNNPIYFRTDTTINLNEGARYLIQKIRNLPYNRMAPKFFFTIPTKN
jgi:hypothetical protein